MSAAFRDLQAPSSPTRLLLRVASHHLTSSKSAEKAHLQGFKQSVP